MFLRRKCLLKHVTGGKIYETGRRGRRSKQLQDERKNGKTLEVGRHGTMSHSFANSLWKRLWTCRKTDYMMMMMMTVMFMKIQVFWNVTICLAFEDISTNTFRSAGNQSSNDRAAPPRKPKLSELVSLPRSIRRARKADRDIWTCATVTCSAATQVASERDTAL